MSQENLGCLLRGHEEGDKRGDRIYCKNCDANIFCMCEVGGQCEWVLLEKLLAEKVRRNDS